MADIARQQAEREKETWKKRLSANASRRARRVGARHGNSKDEEFEDEANTKGKDGLLEAGDRDAQG